MIAVDGERVDSALSLVANIRERAVGDKVTLTVLRGGKQIDLTATLVAKARSDQLTSAGVERAPVARTASRGPVR